MIYLYKILTAIFFVMVLPILPLFYLFSKKRQASLIPRLGIATGLISKDKYGKRIWVHALSVGEVKSAVPLVIALKEKGKALEVIFTASTKTGFDTAVTLFLNPGLVDQVAYFPFDLGVSIRRVCRQINPDAVVLVETDLWPNFLYEMNKQDIPVVLINARLSKRSFNGYLRFKPFARLFFSFLTRIMAQTALDKERFQQLGIDPEKILVTGNIKFDQPLEAIDSTAIGRLKKQLEFEKNDQVVLAGSTHDGEEQIILNWFRKISGTMDNVRLIIAPRDPERSPALSKTVRSALFSSFPLPESGPDRPCPRVMFVDRMGELSKLYAVCDLAFIGGSLVNAGGHNPLEPAAYSKPILFGPDMSDFAHISKALVDCGGSLTVDSDKDLEKQLNRLLNHQEQQKQMGAANFKVFSSHAGAVKTIISRMEQLSIV